MAHINLQNELPGIRGLMKFRPETARHLNELAEILLRSDDNSLTRGERELIGAYVSGLNDCFFCQNVHDYDEDADKNGVTNGPQRINQFLGGSAKGFVENAGYLRFREIGLYYTFGKFRGNVVKGLRMGVTLNNFITFSNYSGYDPEVSNFGTGFSTGVDVDPFPASKRAAFNVTIDF